jgi:hypothetical protein
MNSRNGIIIAETLKALKLVLNENKETKMPLVLYII